MHFEKEKILILCIYYADIKSNIGLYTLTAIMCVINACIIINHELTAAKTYIRSETIISGLHLC
jgi:hypothetical protein